MFRASDFKGKKACVMGCGKSGAAAAKLLARKGFNVLISDGGKAACPVKNKKIEVESGGHTDKIYGCGFIVKSPGIFSGHPVLAEAKKRGIPVFSETEAAVSFLPAGCKLIAITGTNGKTTTTMLTAEIFKKYCGKKHKVFTVGNIGDPLSRYIGKIKEGDYIVMEISSYQLEDSAYFKPDAAAVLNITPDHIDHHGSFEAYAKAKKKIFGFQDKKDTAVINGGDENCLNAAKNIKSNLYCFATTPRHEARAHVFYDGDELVFSSGSTLRPPAIAGLHNIENAMAAALLAIGMGVDTASIQKAFDGFKGAPHRIEKFLVYKGITCIDDSKATNVESTLVALKAMPEEKNLWLILGGRDKGSPYGPLLPLVKKKCKAVLTVGEAAPLIKKDLAAYKNIIDCDTIAAAVKRAFAEGKKGDVLLLSPACASFDRFKNFEERGDYFKKVCRKERV